MRRATLWAPELCHRALWTERSVQCLLCRNTQRSGQRGAKMENWTHFPGKRLGLLSKQIQSGVWAMLWDYSDSWVTGTFVSRAVRSDRSRSPGHVGAGAEAHPPQLRLGTLLSSELPLKVVQVFLKKSAAGEQSRPWLVLCSDSYVLLLVVRVGSAFLPDGKALSLPLRPSPVSM